MSAEDAVSERVRFDDNISFIDDSMGGDEMMNVTISRTNWEIVQTEIQDTK